MIKNETAPVYGAKKVLPNIQIKINEAMALLLNELKARDNHPDVEAFTQPDKVKDYLRLSLALEEREHFHCLFLDNQHQLLQDRRLFSGTIDGASVYPREVAKAALQTNAAAVIFAHNHPSGVPTPSQADKDITEKLKKALKLFDIRVLDHLIVGKELVYSFAESGLL